MIETLTLITLCVLYLVFFRPGKTPLLENPLVIERIGLYRIALAPQLNLAQPFIEAIAKHIKAANTVLAEGVKCSFAVRDKHVVLRGCDYYLLTIMQRDGMLYFEATAPLSQSKFDSGREGGKAIDNSVIASWIDAVQEVAAGQGINIEFQTPCERLDNR